jgi:hypothetical protein
MDRIWCGILASPPVAEEMLNSNKSTLEHQEFFTKAFFEMVEARSASALHIVVIPTIVSPLGVVPKPY